MKTFIAIFFIIFALTQTTQAKTKEEWKSRKIYQLLTDRFARGNGDKSGCDLHHYCGGDFKGIQNNLDYIQNLGFDAIWISPVIDNYNDGYHGYWARDLYKINSNFGTAQDLKNLINAAHQKDIWVMIDIVANHAGNMDQDFHQNSPFNDAAHYHDYCIIQQSDFDSHNLHNIEHCRLAGLADWNHQNAWVADQLIEWGKWLVTEFGTDGLRIDTVMMVPADFWNRFQKEVGVYCVGEVFDGDMQFLSQFVGPLNGLLNYPLWYWMKSLFTSQESMYKIKTYYQQWASKIGSNGVKYMGNFNDNHDNARFLHWGSDDGKKKSFKALTAFTLTSVGIPIFYYGSEQYFGGGDDPANREILWNNMDEKHEMFKFVQAINNATKKTNAMNQEQIERWCSDDLYAFSRGELLALFSNRQFEVVSHDITYHPYKEGQKVCNIFYPNQDCQYIKNGKLEGALNYGEVKIFVPA